MPRPPVTFLVALALAPALVLTACSGSSSSGSADKPSFRVPGGITLTPEGTQLQLGKQATVAWKPTQTKVGVMTVKVTKLEKAPISAFQGFQLDPKTQRSTPYFVHATVHNMGKSNLSKVGVPLYVLEHNTLLQSSRFQSSFAPCPSGPFPAGFRTGAKASVCLVYFVPPHHKFQAVSFRPTQDVDAITWVGPITPSQSHEKHH